MLSINEQKILLKMLLYEKLEIKFRPLGSSILERQNIYATISKLRKDGYVKSGHYKDNKYVFYELTERGELVAIIISKDRDTEEEFRNIVKGAIRWFLD